MKKAEALEVVRSELGRWHSVPWSALRERIEGSPEAGWPRGRQYSEKSEIRRGGTLYQVQIDIFWDDEPDGVIRVLGAVDDGGLRAFMPLTYDFLVRPDGTFIGED